MPQEAGRPLRIVQVTKVAQSGGAERVATTLHEALRRRGQRSWMATAQPMEDPLILSIPVAGPDPGGIANRDFRRVVLGTAAELRRSLHRYRGRESFDYPGTAAIPDLTPEPPDVIHCHNLHGGYFDLRQLAPMSHRLPVALTLHDEWTFTGHCACTLGCERWRTGCGSCPDLTIYPAIARDGTRANRRAKQAIYARSRLYVSTPSQWLMDRARASILAEGAAGWRIIPNGVDLSIFQPGDRLAARTRLGLPAGPAILLFTANRARQNPFKDWKTVSGAAAAVARALTSRRILCLALGDDGPTQPFENGELRFVPYRSKMAEVADFYRAADLYLHAAKAENLPTTILEALASGLPVVATAVGGIPEEVRSLAGAPGAWSGEGHPRDEATGVLVAPGDAVGMGAAAAAILRDDALRATLSANATLDATERFDVERQFDATMEWYREIIADWRERERSEGHPGRG